MSTQRLAVAVLLLVLAGVQTTCREPTRQPDLPLFSEADLGVPEGTSSITWTNYPGWPPQLTLQASSTGEFWGSANVRSNMWWGAVTTCDDPVPQRRFGQESDGSYYQDNDPNPPAYAAVTVYAPAAEVTGTRVRAYMQTLHSFFEHAPYANDGQAAQTNSEYSICLDQPHVTTVTITPATATLCGSGNTTLTATARDQYGNVWTTGTVTWASSNINAATVTSTGSRTARVNAVGPGGATITGTLDGISGTSTLNTGCLPAPTNCTIQYIPQPNYLKVVWVNADPSASTTVEINRNGMWTSPVTEAPGITQYFYILGSERGEFYARVRHTRSGYTPSAYCTTGTTSK